MKPESPPPGPQRADALAAVGKNFVRIGLVADVPNEAVGGGIEYVVQRDGQLDDAKTGAEVAAGNSDSVDRFFSQFIGHLTELVRLEAP